MPVFPEPSAPWQDAHFALTIARPSVASPPAATGGVAAGDGAGGSTAAGAGAEDVVSEVGAV
jgi:hypothetical protein